ncbi:MAG: PilZ domain-containing protein [Acidobacteriia bacterium]|nr:PilZ domain-containing protein [Terriglobia bacterium]
MTLIERRKHPRFPCELAVEVRADNQRVSYPGKLADICLGGCFVSTVSPLPAGTSVMLFFRTQISDNGGAEAQAESGATAAVAGRTVTSLPGSGMGIEFTGVGDAAIVAQLKALIAQLESGPPKETRAAM